VTVPDFVLDAMRRPVIHHRTAAFRAFYGKLCQQLGYLFQTEGVTGTFPGTGTYGVELAMQSLFHPGEHVLVLNLGKFSERWVRYGELIGLHVLELAVPWGESITPDQVQQMADAQPSLGGVVITHSETSTGAVVDLEEMAFALRRSHPECLILVDGITSVGTLPYYHDAWDIDASIVASQKALLNPAGLVAFALSRRAEARLRPTFDGDFANLRNYAVQARQEQFPFTPPLTLLYALSAALHHLEQSSLPVLWQRSHQSARVFRQGLERQGGHLFAQHPSDSLTAFTLPSQDLMGLKARLETEHGLVLAGGQGDLKGKILRVSHMGEADEQRMQQLLAAMKG
jgi:aspartate aminotransferase-like enzyme